MTVQEFRKHKKYCAQMYVRLCTLTAGMGRDNCIHRNGRPFH